MGVYFSVSSLIILIIFAVKYFARKKVKNNETKIYSRLLVITLIGLLLEIITCIWYVVGLNIDSIIYRLLSKLIFCYYINVFWKLIY